MNAAFADDPVMVQLGRPGAINPASLDALRTAMFARGPTVLTEPRKSGDEEQDWADPGALAEEPVLEPAAPWQWHGPADVVEGPSWGGSLEIVRLPAAHRSCLQPDAAYDGCVLMLETSEQLPPADDVSRVLMCMGERGLLGRFAGVLIGRPKAWSLEQRNDTRTKHEYVEQRTAVLRALEEYHLAVPCVTGVDFGHTDPQLVVPHGGTIRLDPGRREITVAY